MPRSPFHDDLRCSAHPLAHEARDRLRRPRARERVCDEQTQALQAQFAGSLRPGERLVVLLRSISLATYTGDINVFQLADNDYLDGVVTLVGPNGQQLATKDILTVSPSSSGGAWYLPGGEQRRAVALAQAFAAWARRYIP